MDWLGLITVAGSRPQQKANVGPLLSQVSAHQFSQKMVTHSLKFPSSLQNGVDVETLIARKHGPPTKGKTKSGPSNSTTAFLNWRKIYAVESISGPRFGFLSQYLVRVLRQYPIQDYFLFIVPNLIVFFGHA